MKLIYIGTNDLILTNARAAATMLCINFEHQTQISNKYPTEGLFYKNKRLDGKFLTEIIKEIENG